MRELEQRELESLPDEVQEVVTAMQGGDGEFFSYSGRGMYGAVCLAYTPYGDVTGWDLLASFLEVSPDVTQVLDAPRQDSLGHGTVFYWPNTPIVSQ